MNYQVVSFNYKKCDLEGREKVSFKSNESIREYLRLLTSFDFILEAFVVNTCNRIEIVAATRDNFSTYHTILGILSKMTGASFSWLEEMALDLEDKDAITHIFSVVSSLDSLVIGEAQITGQVKDAFKFSYDNGTAGKELNRVISYAVKCAAEVRNVTNISQNPISIASVAVAQALETMNGSLSGMTGIVVGSGDMGRLAAKHLLRSKADVVILSRTRAKSDALVEELGENARADDIEKLPRYLNRYRLLFTATSSNEPVITNQMIEEMKINRLWFDMAIPRDIEELEDKSIQLYRIDDLQNISKSNHALRQEQAIKATEVVSKYTDEFYQWLQALTVEPVIKKMRLTIDEVIAGEVKRSIKKGYLPEAYSDNATKMIKQVFDKYLHQPSHNIRELAKSSDGQNIIDAFKAIFDINTDDSDPQKYKKPSAEMLKRLKGEAI